MVRKMSIIVATLFVSSFPAFSSEEGVKITMKKPAKDLIQVVQSIDSTCKDQSQKIVTKSGHFAVVKSGSGSNFELTVTRLIVDSDRHFSGTVAFAGSQIVFRVHSSKSAFAEEPNRMFLTSESKKDGIKNKEAKMIFAEFIKACK